MLLPERTAFLTLRSRSSNYLRGGVASPSPSLFFISIVSIRIPYITHLHLRPESVFPHCQLRAEMDSHHPAYLCPAMSTYGEAIRRYGVLSSWHRAKTEPKSCVIRTPFRARSHLQSPYIILATGIGRILVLYICRIRQELVWALAVLRII
jgi:hypothetical protein